MVPCPEKATKNPVSCCDLGCPIRSIPLDSKNQAQQFFKKCDRLFKTLCWDRYQQGNAMRAQTRPFFLSRFLYVVPPCCKKGGRNNYVLNCSGSPD
ncbi:hypothetical protein Y1Q_0000774 [Alligator mississippiensis]|uniref:Uncharacterized protein n=1 Tax=Alligator mississippiensis TaxID=8496 RepID=A0A151MCC0_ALLMI|nr:hypothetical protein Y1Q_0000774 [Alligator mississippiensis]